MGEELTFTQAIEQNVNEFLTDNINTSLDNTFTRNLSKLITSAKEQRNQNTEAKLVFDLLIIESTLRKWEFVYFGFLGRKVKSDFKNIVETRKRKSRSNVVTIDGELKKFVDEYNFTMPQKSEFKTDNFVLDLEENTVKRKRKIGFY